MKRLFLPAMIFALLMTLQAEEMKMNALTLRQQKIASAAAYAAKGDPAKLRTALASGLDSGVTVNEYKEILTQVYAYCGFPRSLNALGTLMALEQERGNRDAAGKLPGPRPKGKALTFGTANQTKLCGAPVKGPLFDFAPAVDEYLKAHLFGDIFARDNVDWQTRELATIAMLAVVPGVEPQLKAHIAIGKHNGLTDQQVEEILAIARPAADSDPFPKGSKLTSNFTGDAWCAMLISNKNCDACVYNVTFAPGTRNNWHRHAVGQLLLCTSGVGYYQERGKKARRLVPGDVVEIPADTDHWHGAAPDQTFVHLGITPKMSENSAVWLEPVSDADYKAATSGK